MHPNLECDKIEKTNKSNINFQLKGLLNGWLDRLLSNEIYKIEKLLPNKLRIYDELNFSLASVKTLKFQLNSIDLVYLNN